MGLAKVTFFEPGSGRPKTCYQVSALEPARAGHGRPGRHSPGRRQIQRTQGTAGTQAVGDAARPGLASYGDIYTEEFWSRLQNKASLNYQPTPAVVDRADMPYYIFHYTYGVEYSADGLPLELQVVELRLERHRLHRET